MSSGQRSECEKEPIVQRFGENIPERWKKTCKRPQGERAGRRSKLSQDMVRDITPYVLTTMKVFVVRNVQTLRLKS